MNTQTRSGEFAVQPGGHQAFIPKPLPPTPALEIDAEMQALLSRADRALGRLDGSIRTLPNPNLFIFMYVRKEAVLSSQIEGTQSSLNDILEVEAEIFDSEHPRDVDEVLNYVRAMNCGLERLAELPLSNRLIREIHDVLLSGVRGSNAQPGELRKIQNWIGPPGCTLKEATFVPPPPQLLEAILGQFEKFLHDESLPALLQIGMAHAQFETIHPFLDGNGRVGRLLIAFMLYQREILETPVLYISHYFKKYRQQYYEQLQSVRETGSWELWLKFFLQGIYEVSQEATETSRKIVGLREAHRKLIAENFGRVAGNGMQVLETLYQRPFINVQDIIDLTHVSYPAANQLMNKFVDHGLLTEVTGQARNRQFRYGSYIELFS
ncbi:MAG TPA: Fic family protein [Gammaproteobacteria bacterium]|nr:Fic family protein [Gammaproteobacteria bacterium]